MSVFTEFSIMDSNNGERIPNGENLQFQETKFVKENSSNHIDIMALGSLATQQAKLT